MARMVTLITLAAALAGAAAATPASSPRRRVSRCAPAEVVCPIVFDGRVPADAELADFDTANGGGWNPFNPGYVKGNDIKWSEILLLPEVSPASRFDAGGETRPLEVTLSDKSIFMTQYGFRRAGLLFNNDSNNGSPANTGIKTLHFSLKLDPAKALNLTHEYLNVWHESADYSAAQFQFQTGTIIGQDGLPKSDWKLFDRNMKLLWSTPIATDGAWQNFAFTLNWAADSIQVWYSKGNEALAKQGETLSVTMAGEGQFQMGILKKPTGTTDVVNAGYQESDLDEGLVYGGIFIEDSANDCVSK